MTIHWDCNMLNSDVKKQGAASNELFSARAARVVLVSEPTREVKFDSDTIKRFTGTDMIQARRNYGRDPI